MNDRTIKIQNMLLAWLACQQNPVRHERIREICNSCVFSVMGQKEAYSLYRYFYPLVRAGYVECGLEKQKTAWQLTKPMVFCKDFERERRWIGINLTETQKNLIPSCYDLIEDESDSHFEQHTNVIRWTTTKEYDGDKLPIIHNPPMLSILKCLPACSPIIFAKKEHLVIQDCKQIYSPIGKKWESTIFRPTIPDGLYRVSEKVYSRRIYYQAGETYAVGNEADDVFWAKTQHCIDCNIPVARYNAETQCVSFNIDLPFILGRILFINQMFERFLVNSGIYYMLTRSYFTELQRIFSLQIKEGDNDHDRPRFNLD